MVEDAIDNEDGEESYQIDFSEVEKFQEQTKFAAYGHEAMVNQYFKKMFGFSPDDPDIDIFFHPAETDMENKKMDRKYHIDTTVVLPNGDTVAIGEGFRNTKWKDKQTLTITTYNKHGDPSFYYKSRADIYAYGYYDDEGTVEHLVVVKWPETKKKIEEGKVDIVLDEVSKTSGCPFIGVPINQLRDEGLVLFEDMHDADKTYNGGSEILDYVGSSLSNSTMVGDIIIPEELKPTIENLRQANTPNELLEASVVHMQNGITQEEVAEKFNVNIGDVNTVTKLLSGKLVNKEKTKIEALDGLADRFGWELGEEYTEAGHVSKKAVLDMHEYVFGDS